MFDLDVYLAERRRVVQAALEAEMPPATAPPAMLHSAMRYSVFSGGKRLRPILCLAAGEAAGGTPAAALRPALAVELLHTYTLIHDDLPCMDNDDLRRGRPTSHKVFGEANAVLAGDALQALAFELAARTVPPAAYPVAALVAELAAAAGSRGVVGGQVEDLAAAGQAVTAARLEFIHRHKTADLFRAALRMGAMCGNAGAAELAALTAYGVNLGLAFQIADDLLDAPPAGAPPPPGKTELTCLAVWTPAEARAKAEALAAAATRALDGTDPARSEPLIAIARYVIARDQ